MIKKLYHTGLVAYLLLLILSIVLYKERVVFLDAAYHLFHILKEGHFAIQHNRYGAAVTEIFPVLCAKLSIPLNASMYIYSACFIIYYGACYWICGSVLKQYKLALSLLLFNILFVTDTFYWIPSELPQGIAFLIVTIAVLISNTQGNNNTLRLLVLLPLILAVLFFHPLMLIPACFITGYFILNNNLLTNKRLFYIVSGVLIVLFYVKHKMVTSPYDVQNIQSGKEFIRRLPQWHNLYSTKLFLKNCLGSFIWIPICSVIISIVYIRQSRWLNLCLFAGFTLGYLVLVTTSYPTDYTKAFYIENLYLPLGLFIAIPFVYDVLPRLEQKQLGYILFILIISTGLIRIYMNHDVYSNRLTWERKVLSDYPGKKLLMNETPGMTDTLIMAWGTPYEFWLLSTTESADKETATIFVTDTLDKFYHAHWDRKSFITNWQTIDYSTLPAKYFNLNDTFSRYEIVR